MNEEKKQIQWAPIVGVLLAVVIAAFVLYRQFKVNKSTANARRAKEEKRLANLVADQKEPELN